MDYRQPTLGLVNFRGVKNLYSLIPAGSNLEVKAILDTNPFVYPGVPTGCRIGGGVDGSSSSHLILRGKEDHCFNQKSS